MKLRALDWLACPDCGGTLHLADAIAAPSRPVQEVSPPSACRTCTVGESEEHQRAKVAVEDCARCYQLEILEGRLWCERSHEFPIQRGVPRLTLGQLRGSATPSRRDPESIRASFSSEWAHFEYDDTTWTMDVDARCDLVLRELDVTATELNGTLVLDAGCGNGSLSRGLHRFGCELVGIDVSDAVLRAFEHFSHAGNDRTHFLQGDLMRLPLRPESFDFVYSSGVLHHNPDTRAAFESVLRALKPGGKIYIWVYEPIPGWRHAWKQRFRDVVAPLPNAVKHAIVGVWSVQSMARQYLRKLVGRSRPNDHIRWRERMVLLLDHYTPRYRWEHTQEELHTWYRELGLHDVATTEVREWGFGVVGTKPARQAIASACAAISVQT